MFDQIPARFGFSPSSLTKEPVSWRQICRSQVQKCPKHSCRTPKRFIYHSSRGTAPMMMIFVDAPNKNPTDSERFLIHPGQWRSYGTWIWGGFHPVRLDRTFPDASGGSGIATLISASPWGVPIGFYLGVMISSLSFIINWSIGMLTNIYHFWVSCEHL